MVTIHTRYIGPTNTKGARISITRPAYKQRLVVRYDHSARDAHDAAVVEFMAKFDCTQGRKSPIPVVGAPVGFLKRGESESGRGYTYVDAQESASIAIVPPTPDPTAAQSFWRRERARMTRDDKIGYHPFVDDDGESYGSFEVFHVSRADKFTDDDGNALRTGYYWHACFPGCLPDGDPCGPFKTSQEAYNDAMEGGA